MTWVNTITPLESPYNSQKHVSHRRLLDDAVDAAQQIRSSLQPDRKKKKKKRVKHKALDTSE